MYRILSSWIKPFFSLNKSEQRGIIILIAIILTIAIINILLPTIYDSNVEKSRKEYRSEIDSFIAGQQLIKDSINIEFLQNSGEIDVALAKQKLTPVKFNPNKLPVEVWKKMGLTDRQIRNIKNYEAKGGKFKRKEDLKKIYLISDIEYAILEPYINIPSLYKTTTGKVKRKKAIPKVPILKNTEINSANSEKLISTLGLSPWLAKRTISYRNVLGGFVNKKQLKEVYGLNDSIYDNIKDYINVNTELIKKIDINNITFKKLLKHPYFDYSTTKLIFNARNKAGSFESLSQIELIDNIADTTIYKISGYIIYRPKNN